MRHEQELRLVLKTCFWVAVGWLIGVVLWGCGPLPGEEQPFGVGPQVGCEQVHALVDAYVLAQDRAPADWQPTTMNPDCGLLPPEFPQVCDVLGPRESFNPPQTECYVHIDFDCEGQDTEAWWYTVAAGVDGIVVGAADCGWQVFF